MSSSYGNRVTRVPLDHLVANPYQPRFSVDDDGIAALVDSIREYGFVGHVEVRRDPTDPALPLQIVFGHRRVEAARRAGLATIPAVIVDRSDDQMRRLTFVENAARKDLSYWEEAVFVGQMRQELNLSVRQLAAALGKPKSWVQERLDILRLPAGPLREAAERDEIAFSAAWLLVQMDPKERDELFRSVKRGDLNVSDLRALRQARARAQSDDGAISERIQPTAQQSSPVAVTEREAEPHPLATAGRSTAPSGSGPLGADGPNPVTGRPLPGRMFEVLLPRPEPPANDANTKTKNAPPSPPPPSAPPVDSAATAAMAARTSVLALVRELEVTTRSLQARLRGVDFARLTAEEQSALDRARSSLQSVLAGIG